jgi:aspartyl-tRNA(Asn)/glutamyl-tRNA(Gln) amidotransferase subunit C
MEINDIQKLAELSRIEMSDEELTAMAKDFDSILGYVTQIQEVKTLSPDGEPAVAKHHNIMRDDETPHESGTYTQDVVKNMPETDGGYLSVKKIL